MINIWICEDNRRMLLLIGAFVKRYFRTSVEEAIIEEYFSGKEVVDLLIKENKAPDILFVAIRMRKVNGYQVAREFTKNHCRTLLIFVTAFKELFFESIKFAPFGFILKSSMSAGISFYIERAIKKIHSPWINKLELEYKGRRLGIDIDAIYIIYSINKKTVIKLNDGETISIRLPLKSIYDTLSDSWLVMTSRSEIINLKYSVDRLGKDIIMADGSRVQVSRRRYSAFKRRYQEYCKCFHFIAK